MITIMFCIRRKPSISQQAFLDCWLGHGKLVAKHAQKLGIVRYVQNHGVHQAEAAGAQAQRGLAEQFDGVAEISFASWEDIERGLFSPEVQSIHQELMADELNFVDHGRSSTFFTEAVEIDLTAAREGRE
ncbi:MAG TPA: EthD domain-containing protein [Novosphingobium sp.]